MKANFKPLGLAAAVAAASAGFAGVANAQATYTSAGLGDLAIVPYYTVVGDFVTGVHITNTSDQTQVVKLRLRRATDSMDALDFNLVLSPQDVWTGYLSGGDGEDITFTTTDNSCSVPEAEEGGVFTMPGVYREGADEGYIEVIGMGAPASESQVIAVAAKHTSEGVPLDCDAVRSNFFADAWNSSSSTDQTSATPELNGTNTYVDAGDVLKVSFFIRDAQAGLEAGNDAVHLAGFLDYPTITNQEFGIFSGDTTGFDFPDLNGGSPADTPRGVYEDIRAELGAAAVVNDWSANADLGVGTDWVVTVPGQYTMLDLPQYLLSLVDEEEECTPVDCDFRDIPLTASYYVYDREEATIADAPGELVVSPSIPGEVPTSLLPNEVNVIEWGTGPVLDTANPITVTTPEGSDYGWASLSVEPAAAKTQQICNWMPSASGIVTSCAPVVNASAPVVGFVAWERNFPSNQAANYGRIINHSYVTSSAD